MTTRTGMANPIQHLRELTQAGTAEFTLGTVSYWSDQHLQDALDAYRADVYRAKLADQITYDGSGTAKYYDYYFEGGTYEEGTAAFVVADSLGNPVTPTSVEYARGHVSFGTVNQMGTAYFLTGKKFDIYRAAADVWRRKAANVASAYDFNTDGQSMSRSQLQKQYLQMASECDAKSQPTRVTMRRG
jgi:hypothetical protein